MHKVLLDTNQLVSSVLSARGVQGRIVDAWRRRAFALYVAPGQVEEGAEVLARPKIARKYSITLDDRQALVALLHAEAVLGCAAAGHVDDVVTGDAALLAVGQYQGVTVVDGRQFLGVLSSVAE